MLKTLWQREEGIVLPLVVVMLAIFTLLGFGAMFMVENQGLQGEKTIKRMEALHYAEAGVHEYLGHENRKTNVPWDRWDEPIPFEDGFYQLAKVDVDEKSLARTIRSTGWLAGNEGSKRTVQVDIGRIAFNQYAYFSNSDSYTVSNGQKQPVYWSKNEKCYGPYHTNDTLYIQSADSNQRPVFYGHVTYVNGVEGRTVGRTDYSNNLFRAGHNKVTAIEVPKTNYQIKERALENGHYYSGLTRILLKGNTYDVVFYEPKTTGQGNSTRTEYVRQERLNMGLPENGVIYVDGGSSGKFAETSGNLFIAGELSGNLTVGVANEIYLTGYDPTEDNWLAAKEKSVPSRNTQGITYQNTKFSVLKKGSEIVGYEPDTSLADDLLGLVANKDIKILGKGWFNNPNPNAETTSGTGYNKKTIPADAEYDVAPTDITIHGAIFSISEGFGYETHDVHNKGKITLRGSLIQSTRKPVGLADGSKGYTKDYAHDPRMLTSTPPGFPEPLNTGWEIKQWIVDPDY